MLMRLKQHHMTATSSPFWHHQLLELLDDITISTSLSIVTLLRALIRTRAL